MTKRPDIPFFDVLNDRVTELQGDPGDSSIDPAQANAQHCYEVTRADLPLHCPMEGMNLWNSHPRVYLPIEATGLAKCPYCGADYVLKDKAQV